jgi:hypothetical protein
MFLIKVQGKEFTSMSSAYICATIFFNANPDVLAAMYEACADPAEGYLTRLNRQLILTDAAATASADWARQAELATALALEDTIAISVFLTGRQWAIAVAHNGLPGPVAVFDQDDHKAFDQLPFKLLAIEETITLLFPKLVDKSRIDMLFGAMLEDAISPEEGMASFFEMLGCPQDWPRWSWYDTIPEQLFLDPDLAERVTPLGEAKKFWEE